MTDLDLIRFADAWASLGDAITSQLRNAIEAGVDDEDNHPTAGALQWARERLSGPLRALEDCEDADFSDLRALLEIR